MNRVLLVVNALLALFLLVRALQSPVAAASRVATLEDRVRVEPEYGPDGRARALLVELGADLGPAQATGEPVDLGVQLDPPQPALTTWRTPHSLVVVPATPLPRARSGSVVFARDLTRGERAIAAGTVVRFATPAIQLLQVVVGGEGTERASLTAVFDQPVSRVMAKQMLSLRRAGQDRRAVPCEIALPGAVDSAAAITLRPLRDQEVPDDLELVLGAGLLPVGGNVPLGLDVVQPVRMRQPLRVVEVAAADGRVDIALTRKIEVPAASSIRVEPAVAFQVLPTARGVRLVGSFPPGSVVHVELAAGFPGTGDARLTAAVRRSVLMPDRTPELGLSQGGSVLCASAAPRLQVTGCNVKEPRLRLQRVYPNNLVRALQRGDEPTLEPAEAVAIPVAAARNEVWTQEVDVAAVAGAALRGLYRVDLWHRESSYYPEHRWLQVTDLGITLRTGHESAVVQVVDLVTGGPVAGAAVVVLTPTNQELARGVTDAEGLLAVSWRAFGSDRKPFLVLAQRGDDVAFVGTGSERVELADEGLGGRAFVTDGAEAWVWPSRGIVRPGETLDAAVLVRDGRGLPRPGMAVEARFVSPNRRVVLRQTLALPGSGLVQASLPLALDAPTGEYSLEVATVGAPGAEAGKVLGSARFRVEAFVPDRLEVEVVSVSALRFGAPGRVKVRGRWLDGAPASGQRVSARVRLLAHALQFPQAPEFTFAMGMDEPPPGELPAVEGELDAAGEAELTFALPAEARQQGLLANIAVELQDPSGRVVRAGQSAPVHRTDLHLGVRAAAGRCELRVLDGAGAPLAAEQRATVRLEQREWSWQYRQLDSGRWRWSTERVRTTLGEWNVTVRGGEASQPLPAADTDCFVVVTLGGRTVEQPLGQVAMRPDRLRVQAGREPVAAGGTARLVVTSPAAGRGLVTFESDRLHGAVVVALQRGDTVLDVPVPAGLTLPNVHAVVTLTRPVPKSGPDQGPAWLIGGAPIRLARPELELPLTIAAPAQLQPDETWRCGITANGATTALVALVDEGVLRITGHADPDPRAFLLANRALGTDGADTASALLQGMQFAAGAKTGGDGEDEGGLLVGSVDNRIRPYVRFARVDLDAEGRGEAAFPLAGYEGRVRAMVVAAGPLGVAAARGETIVKAPLGVQLATPRMVAPGDTFVLPVTLRSTLAAGVAHVEVRAEGALALRGEAPREIPLAQAGERTFEVPVEATAPAPGTLARLRVTARLGDVQREVVAEFTVRARTLWQRETIGVELSAGSELEIGSDWQGVEASVRLDTRPDPQLAPVLQRLLDYPFGCAEQTTSVALAVLACRTMMPRWFGDQDPRVLTANDRLASAVQRLATMQTERGGFGWWPGSDGDAPFVTAHVVDFLSAAREQGIEVDGRMLEAALDRCQQWLQNDGEATLRCQLVDVLARAGRPVQPWLDWLCAQSLGVDDRLRLAAVLGRLGQRDRALALLGDDGETMPRKAASGDLASPLRSQAMRLAAVLAIDGKQERLPALARALQRAIAAQDRATTQENTQCLRVLADYYRRLPAAATAAAATVMVDGVATTLGDGVRTLAVQPGGKLVFAGGGSGFALVELRGQHRVVDVPVEQGLSLVRTVVDLDTGLPVKSLRRGRLYEVRILVEAAEPVVQLAIVDLLPGGLEAEASQGLPGAAASGEKDAAPVLLQPRGVERRDDRVLFFLDRAGRRGEIRHRVRATMPGTYAWPALRAEAMYDPDVRFTGAVGAPLVVEP